MQKFPWRLGIAPLIIGLMISLGACTVGPKEDFDLPDPTLYDSGIEYMQSEARMDAFEATARPAGDELARALQAGELGETTALWRDGEIPNDYSGAGLIAAPGSSQVVLPFSGGEPDLSKVQALTVGADDDQVTIYVPDGLRPYWDVTVGPRATQLLIEAGASAQEFYDLDLEALDTVNRYMEQLSE